MRTRRREQRDNHQNLAEADEHADKLNLPRQTARRNYDQSNLLHDESMFGNPDQRAARQQIKERD